MAELDEEVLVLMNAIHKMIEWFNELLDASDVVITQSSVSGGQRVFSDEECEILSLESRHYLLILEQKGILTPSLRERIINQAMLLPTKNIELPVIESLTRILLMSQQGIAAALATSRQPLLPWSNSLH